MLEHSIDLTEDAKHTAKERGFANEIFSAMENACIITRKSSLWGSRTKFPPKKKGSEDLRVFHNFIPINTYTIKSSHPVHRFEEVLNTIIKPGFDVYFTADASNGYWVVPMKDSDCNKAGFVTFSGSWVDLRMGQGLKGAAHTYFQLSDLVFGPLPATNDNSIPRQDTIIGTSTKEESAFSIYMDDHAGAAKNFNAMFTLLHTKYFPRVAFGPVYLAGKKTRIFDACLQILGYEEGNGGSRPSVKYRRQIAE